MTQALPQLPDDRFEIVEVLGEGGMATVYRALDRETQEWCAVKVLHEKYIPKPRIRQRFTIEAKAMMRLKHRNVCHVIHLNGDAVQPYFAMELAQGGCVVDWIAAHGAMPPKMAVDIAIQVCKGLGAAHRQGVVHRDVKPHNILVNRRGVCKITDFGIAQLDDEEQASLTRTGSVMGTLGYIAPEQRSNAKDVDERSDVYSVAATLYTMVTARTTMDLFFADQEPDMMNGVHEALVPVITKATRYRREERHQTMRELAKDLYHVKALLPDDPEDTPSLVMNSLVTLNEELQRFTTSDKTAETPLSALLTPHSDTDGTFSSSITPANQSTTPGIPRAQLLREQEEAERDASTRWILQAAIGGLALMGLLGIVTGGAALSGRSAVLAEAAVAQQAQDGLESVLDAEYGVVDELAELGANPSQLQALWVNWKAVQGPERLTRVGVLIQRYRQLLNELEPPSGTSRVHFARKASGRLERIDEALAKAQRAEATVEEARNRPAARLAGAVFDLD